MTATTFTLYRTRAAPRGILAERWALPLILVVAAANFFWQLGSSSYFTDEAYSVIHSLPSYGSIFRIVAHTETTPWTYFLFLHEWLLRTGSQAEWVARLPSALAGVALVGAVYWMMRAFVERPVALWAAGLCAISPLIQSYAQEVRVYVFAMLALVVAVGATVGAIHRPRSRARLLTIGAFAACLALWLHYTAISIVLPLAIWVATRRQLSGRDRTAFVGACVVAQAILMPLLLQQYGYFPNGGAISGEINWTNVVSVTGTPFGVRIGAPLNVWSIVAAIILVCAAFSLLLSPDRRRVAARGLLVALGVVGLIGLLGLDLAGKHILITRYTAVTAPFGVAMIAAACSVLPRTAALVFTAATLAVAVAGLAVNHSPSGRYAPTRQVVEYIALREQPRDFMLTPGFPLTDVPLFYYDTRRLKPKLHMLGLGDPGASMLFRRLRNLWIVDNPSSATPAAALALVQPLLRAHRYGTASLQLFTTSITLAVIRAVPLSRAPPASTTPGARGTVSGEERAGSPEAGIPRGSIALRTWRAGVWQALNWRLAVERLDIPRMHAGAPRPSMFPAVHHIVRRTCYARQQAPKPALSAQPRTDRDLASDYDGVAEPLRGRPTSMAVA